MSDDGWLSDHLLGEDDPQGRRAAEERLAADPDLRRRAQRLGEVVDRLQTLPDAVWTDAARAAAPDGAPDPDPDGARTLRPRSQAGRRVRTRSAGTRRLAGTVAVLLALGAGVGIGAAIWSGAPAPGPAPDRVVGVITLRAIGSAPQGAAGRVRLLRSGGLALGVSGLPPSTRGHYYEAWLMTSRTRLVALTSFRVGATGRATLTMALPAPAHAYRYVDISLQDVAGGPAHSADSVLRGATS